MNMSLDDLIKSHPKKRAPKKNGNNGKQAAAGGDSKPATPVGKNNRNRRNKKNTPNASPSSSAMDVEAVKVAKTVGAAKAKRSAKIDQKRGLRASGTATKKEVTQAVKKQTAKAVQSSGLQISFRPKDLPKTTEKAVSAQIRAVLSRQVVATKGPAAAAKNATPRSAGSNGSSKGGSSTKNPKARKNLIVKIQR